MDGDRAGVNAKPLEYQRAYLADVAPPGIVTPVSEAIFAENPCIVLEGRDIQFAIVEGIEQNGLDKRPTREQIDEYGKDLARGNIRYFLHLASARAMACHLIYALADSDDRIAKRLAEVLEEEYESIKEEESNEG